MEQSEHKRAAHWTDSAPERLSADNPIRLRIKRLGVRVPSSAPSEWAATWPATCRFAQVGMPGGYRGHTGFASMSCSSCRCRMCPGPPSGGLRRCVIPHTLVVVATWSALAELNHPGASIRERRIELGWTQSELAKRTGVPQADISRIENGLLDARWSTIQRISAALATTESPRRRSLANGGKVADIPTRPSTRWQPRQHPRAASRETP